MSEETTYTSLTSIEQALVAVMINARSLGDAALAAYWAADMRNRPSNVSPYHRQALEREMAEVLAAIGRLQSQLQVGRE